MTLTLEAVPPIAPHVHLNGTSKRELIDQQIAGGAWAMGDTFSLVDCSAFPALFYGNKVEPFGAARRNVTAYLDRLSAHPSIARVLKEAEPYFKLFPQ